MIDTDDIDGLLNVLLRKDFTNPPMGKSIAFNNLDDEEILRALIKILQYENPSRREKAAEALGIIGNNVALNSLINALSTDTDHDVRIKSAWALGQIKDEIAVFPLIKALEDDPKGSVRSQIVLSLGNIGDDLATDPLIWTLKDRDWQVRKCAADALGKIEDPRAIKPLIDTLNDEDADVRRKTMMALEKFAYDAVELLIEALKQKDAITRINSAEVLGKIGDPQAVNPLINALDPMKKRDKNKYARAKIVEALGKIGDERAVKILKKESESEFIFIRNKAQEALERIRSSGASTKIMQYNDGEIYFRYPNSWITISPSRKKQLIQGRNLENGIKFSVNKIGSEYNISLEELLEILRDGFNNQEIPITSETIYDSGDMNVHKIVGENIDDNRAVMVLAFWMFESIYYIFFKGKAEVFEKIEDDINIITDSFLIIDDYSQDL